MSINEFKCTTVQYTLKKLKYDALYDFSIEPDMEKSRR